MGATFESLGASVTIGHRSEITPESVISQTPDLLVIGAAIRKFMTGPASKRWMSRLATAAKKSGGPIPRGAIFITHIMPEPMASRRAERFIQSVKGYNAVGDLHPGWFSGPVQKILGPLVDGTLEAAEARAGELFEWVSSA